jgi:hypothetical protein
MKGKIKLTGILILLLLSFGCNDWMELTPPSGLIREEFWKKKEDVTAVLAAAYSSFSSLNRSLFLFGEIRGDMLEGDYNQPFHEEKLMASNIYPDNPLSSWGGFYTVINYCNEVILNAPKVQQIDNTFNDYYRKSLVAEAYFLRSLSYFYLVRIFNEVPLVLEPTISDNTDFFIPKSTEDMVLDQIMKDLKENRDYAPAGSFPTEAENKGRASKAAFDALMADISLWRFDYEATITYVQRIESTNKFVLLPPAKWFENFYPGNSLESIFELQFNGGLNQPNATYELTNLTNHNYLPSQKAIMMFGFDYAIELVRGEQSSISRINKNTFVIWKYVGKNPDGVSYRSGSEQRSCNWNIYRYADLLLMKAEALSQSGRFQESLEIINRIRNRAGVPEISITESPVFFEDAILDERASELAYEGKRWFDLLRMGRRNNYLRKDKLVEIIVSNVPSSQKRILGAKLIDPLGWYLPIYTGELDRNNKLVQNPYYD